MITCPVCGKELKDEYKFCDNCGTQIAETQNVGMVFCPNCGAQNSSDSAFCQSCSSPLHDEIVRGNNVAAKKPVKIKPILFGAIGVMAVILIVVIASQFIGGGNSSSDYALYLKGGELYYNNFSKSAPIEITSRLGINNSMSTSMFYPNSNLGFSVALCSDGKTLFYPDRWDSGEFSLYCRNIKKPSDEPTRIDTGITSYFVTEKGDKIFYIKGGTLYQNDQKDNKEKIASDIVSFSVTLDGTKIAYQDVDGNLYVWAGGEKNHISSDIDYVYQYSDDLSTIYYIKENSVYKYTGDDSEKLISNYDYLIRIYDTDEIYYITSEEKEFTLADYVDDDKFASDAAMEAPESPTAPSRPSYWSYDDNDEYAAAQSQYEIDYAAYQAAYEQYQADTQEYREKQNRDNLRTSLESQTLNRTVYSLYYFNGSDSILISDALSDAYDYSCAANKPVAAVRLSEREEISKVRLSEISSASEVSSRVAEAMNAASEYYIVTGDSISAIDQEDIYTFYFAEDGSKIFFIADVDNSYEYGDLYQITTNNGQVGSPSLYDSDVVVYSINIMSDGTVYYFKDVNSRNEGELYVDQKSVEFDVYCYSPSYDSDLKTLFYYTDYSSDRGDGTLMMYKNNTSIKISDDVYDFTVINGDDILYLYDFSSRSFIGTLYLYDGKTAEKIDDDVSGIVRIYNTERRLDYFGW